MSGQQWELIWFGSSADLQADVVVRRFLIAMKKAAAAVAHSRDSVIPSVITELEDFNRRRTDAMARGSQHAFELALESLPQFSI